jgi:6,7-dimethyl-8-ribityllumazine synthase
MTATEGSLPLPRLDPSPRLLIVAAPFYRAIADDLVAGARAVLDRAGAGHETVEVPGALEIPTAIRLAARAGVHDGFVALGCVIRGETTHYEIVSTDSSRGLMHLGLEGLCIGNGILTCETMEQAHARAAPAEAGGQDMGGGAAAAALHLIALARRFRAPGPAQGPGRAPDDAEFLLAGGTGLTRTA